jgi:hypothetical protein
MDAQRVRIKHHDPYHTTEIETHHFSENLSTFLFFGKKVFGFLLEDKVPNIPFIYYTGKILDCRCFD